MVIVIFHKWRHCEVKAPNNVVLVLIVVDLSCLLIVERGCLTLVKFELRLAGKIILVRGIVRSVYEWLVRCEMSLFLPLIIKNSFSCNNPSIILSFMAIHLTFDKRPDWSLLLSYELFLNIMRYRVLN